MYELLPLVLTPPNLRVIPPCVDTIKLTNYRSLCGTTTLHVNAITMQMYEFSTAEFLPPNVPIIAPLLPPPNERVIVTLVVTTRCESYRPLCL